MRRDAYFGWGAIFGEEDVWSSAFPASVALAGDFDRSTTSFSDPDEEREMAALRAGVLSGVAKLTERSEDFMVRVLSSRRSAIFFLIFSLRDKGFARGGG